MFTKGMYTTKKKENKRERKDRKMKKTKKKKQEINKRSNKFLQRSSKNI